MTNDNYKVKLEYGVSAVVVLTGLFFVYQASTIGVSKEAVGPRTMPMALAVSLVLGGLWLAFRAFRGKVGPLREGYGFLESNLKRISLVVGCGAVFVIMMVMFGYFVAIIVYLRNITLCLWRQRQTKNDMWWNYHGDCNAMAFHGHHETE